MASGPFGYQSKRAVTRHYSLSDSIELDGRKINALQKLGYQFTVNLRRVKLNAIINPKVASTASSVNAQS